MTEPDVLHRCENKSTTDEPGHFLKTCGKPATEWTDSRGFGRTYWLCGEHQAAWSEWLDTTGLRS